MPQREYDATPALLRQLREQINKATGVAQLLAPLVAEHGEARHGEYLAILNQSIYRTLRMIRNMEFSMSPPKAEELRPVVLDLAGLCRNTWRDAVDLLGDEAGIAFSYDEKSAATALVRGDEELLRRLLLNLVSNAAQAAGEGGTVTLKVSADSEQVRFTVWNSGGDALPTGERAAEDELLPASDGLGLGLGIARTITALHGGALVFQRQAGKGVSATAAFPVSGRSRLTLRQPDPRIDLSGGFHDTLLELSCLLPGRAFSPAS